MNDVYGINTYSKWEEDELGHMAEQTNQFKHNEETVFWTYQKFCICNVKWHSLNHNCE